MRNKKNPQESNQVPQDEAKDQRNGSTKSRNRSKKQSLEDYKAAKVRGIVKYGSKSAWEERFLFSHIPRHYNCFTPTDRDYLAIRKITLEEIINLLSRQPTIEHQILALRASIILTKSEYKRRFAFSKKLLLCLLRHHNVIYQGFMFGSSVNGMGFRDSDVDLRLRPLKQVEPDTFEPAHIDDDMVDCTLRNIAQQTTRCSPALGDYVPSSRCPVAKLLFFEGRKPTYGKRIYLDQLTQGLKYDITLSSSSHLGVFNSMFLRFLCSLEPRFHLLVTVMRYWSTTNELTLPGYLSSYALANMVIFFCQTIQPPLLPTVDEMREAYLNHESQSSDEDRSNRRKPSMKAITQLEWQCIVSFDKSHYKESTNKEPVSVLLLKFFEFYLNFPYSNQIITIRRGRTVTHEEFKTSTLFHPTFPIRDFLNIQDPFDLKHNLTSGMDATHFRKLITTMLVSYERLFNELNNRFLCPYPNNQNHEMMQKQNPKSPWGLITLFMKLTDEEQQRFKPRSQKKIVITKKEQPVVKMEE